jgi:hypothetical protein
MPPLRRGRRGAHRLRPRRREAHGTACGGRGQSEARRVRRWPARPGVPLPVVRARLARERTGVPSAAGFIMLMLVLAASYSPILPGAASPFRNPSPRLPHPWACEEISVATGSKQPLLREQKRAVVTKRCRKVRVAGVVPRGWTVQLVTPA